MKKKQKNLLKLILISQVYNIYHEIRKIIYRYIKFVYQTEYIGEANLNNNFSVDESLMGNKNNRQLWLMDIINNNTKEKRLEV